ncbi:FHA domain-containing protein [Catenisphaera adipataccumulans]|uniref:FHA domain-containing protein n=1 Tax=Catenisphaera adipataccumulans TaxID=700500 RepID=A0A7W8FXC9_9FIRM|nr:FHA domain-containing protein [Catenisphaera adipataccumulans]MBB5183580.1 hypothetical protein [Catenisphaera adipataccumulans]
MHDIILYSAEFCRILPIRQMQTYRDFVFRIVSCKLEIKHKKKVVILDKGQTTAIDDLKIHFSEHQPYCSAVPFQDETELGRNPECTYRIVSNCVSGHHLRFSQGKVIDLNSTNGTYVNGRRIHEIKYQNGDQILIGFHSILIVETFLISTIRIDSKLSFPSSMPKIELQPHSMPPVTVLKPVQRQWEIPRIIPEVEKGNWFQAVGSSMMICFFGISTALVTWLTNPEFQDQIFSTVLNSLSMGAAFLVYGLLNRRHTWKAAYRKKIDSEQKYQNYLRQSCQEAEQIRLDMQTSFEQLKKACFAFDADHYGRSLPIWIKTEKKPAVIISYSHIDYEHTDHALVHALQEQAAKAMRTIVQPVLLQPGMRIRLDSASIEDALYLYAQSRWQNENVKWVWITKKRLDSVLADPACQEQGYRLWIREPSDVSRIPWDPQHVYRTVSDGSSPALPVKPEAEIQVSLQPGDFDLMVSVDEIPLVQPLVVRQVRAQPLSDHPFDVKPFLKADWKKEVCLKIPIGMDESGSIIWLDFSDQQDGPHGLVAGSTGSGKSEWLTAMLAMLAVKNDPSCLQYILIDFKGGAFGDVFYQFPHCAGFVTNLEGAVMDRFCRSVQAELIKRQKALRTEHVSNIDAFNQKASECMSHLFIVVDEFAQLKMKYPEYMDQLKEIARIGRSLGIHMVLCTQKPLGVVDEQIWSNTRWKVCFRVNDTGDSREVLQNDHAAALREVGSFIVQVGSHEWERKGHGFWMQAPANAQTRPDWAELDDEDRILHRREQSAETLLQGAAREILKHGRKHAWIVLPSMENLEFDQGIIVDRPEWQRQDRLRLDTCRSVLFCQDKKEQKTWFDSCLAWYQDQPVYVYGLYGKKAFVDDEIDEKALEKIERGLILAFVDRHAASFIQMLRHTKRPWIVMTSDCNETIRTLTQTADLQMILSWHDLDTVRYFSDAFAVPKLKLNHGILKTEKGWNAWCYHPAKPHVLQRSRYPVMAPQPFKIGISVHGRLIAWDGRRKCLFAFAQASCREKVDRLIEAWLLTSPILNIGSSWQDDVICIDCLHQSNRFQDPYFMDIQYDLDILWIGAGCSEFAYLFHRSPPPEENGEAIWFSGTKTEVIRTLDA